MTRTFRFFAIASLLASSCGRPTSDRTGPSASTSSLPVRSSFSGKATAALALRPEIAVLVDALAAENAIESSHVGAGGTPSAVYQKFEAISTKATAAELGALLTHTSPVVRGYTGQYLASVPARASEVASLADDETVVKTLNGCLGGDDTVGRVVREALCNSPHIEAGVALVAVHRHGGAQAAEALACAAPMQPKLAGQAAVDALRRGNLAPLEQASYLRVLAVAPDPSVGCELARTGAASGNASVQIGAARALGRCDDAPSLTALEQLAAGRNVVVARNAKASLYLLNPAQREALAADHAVSDEANERLGQRLRSPDGQRGALALAESLALAHPDLFWAPFHRAAATPEATAAARRIAAKLPPAVAPGPGGARRGVIAYLARVRDRDSLPELRRSLDSGDTVELTIALEAVGAMRDAPSRAAVEKLTHHSDAWVAKAAREALAAL